MGSKLVTDIIGSAAAILSVASFVPQIVKMIQTKDVSGVSLRTYALTVTCFALWIIYGGLTERLAHRRLERLRVGDVGRSALPEVAVQQTRYRRIGDVRALHPDAMVF